MCSMICFEMYGSSVGILLDCFIFLFFRVIFVCVLFLYERYVCSQLVLIFTRCVILFCSTYGIPSSLFLFSIR